MKKFRDGRWEEKSLKSRRNTYVLYPPDHTHILIDHTHCPSPSQEERATQEWIQERRRQKEETKKAREEVKMKLDQDRRERESRAGKTGWRYLY